VSKKFGDFYKDSLKLKNLLKHDLNNRPDNPNTMELREKEEAIKKSPEQCV
tara:strand:+ start:145 stop:297 length:153 start_codon:yes stop_codon:yes gene_type:complete